MENLNLLEKPFQRLKTARIAKGYANAKNFSMQYQLSYSTYSAHESGRIELTEKSAKKYGEILGVPFKWLLYGDIEGKENSTNTTSIHLKRAAYEPILMPKVLAHILRAINKFDPNLDYQALLNHCSLITKEIISRDVEQEEMDTCAAAIVGLSKNNLKEQLIKK